MKRIDTINARENVNGLGKKGFHDNSDLEGQDATYVSPSWLNTMQEEVANVIENSAMELDPNDNSQLLKALQFQISSLAQAIYHVGSWHGSNNTSYNPATALKPFFGYETTWILWPYVPQGVGTLNDAVGAISGLSAGSPFQAASTRIWERLADGASAPTYQVTVDKNIVDEGANVTFNIETTGLAAGTPVHWSITGIEADDILPAELSGEFIINEAGLASKSFSIVADNATEDNQTLTFKLTYIPNKQVTVLIMDTSKYPEGKSTYFEGTHNLTVRPKEIITVDMFGAGGGGGGSCYSPSRNPTATNGGDVVLTYGSNSITAGGGKGGTGGVWGNGSSFYSGEGGKGGTNNINADSSFTVLVNQAGNTAVIVDRYQEQLGAVGLDSSIGIINGGGNGAWGIGDENWSYGGGGGSGGRVKVQFTNNTSDIVTLTLVIGARGLGWIESGNHGSDGGVGFAVVTHS
ncbi:hypothetical protein ACG9XY_12315 [Acinetobacter seifertii]|uniref:hypothetical protein n=1 Tax=Acinetobacter seifertii TaxID=1530123 RepID=UPI002940A75F|nr:hypothetical protein [Acinetobacter seifertii]MDV4263304.1 hypothetical protein [Acinetobacter seifertii]